MASLGGTKVVLFGGWNGNVVLSTTWVFDGTQWTLGPTGPGMRYGCAMASFGDKVVLFGGQSDTQGTALGDTWIFDGTSWQPVTGTGPAARSSAAMAALGNGAVLFGGTGTGAPPSDTWTFDGAWHLSTATGPVGRIEASMATQGNVVLLYGGGGYGDMWSFDGSSWTLVANTNPPGARASFAMATLP
jgi:hypothetical protein